MELSSDDDGDYPEFPFRSDRERRDPSSAQKDRPVQHKPPYPFPRDEPKLTEAEAAAVLEDMLKQDTEDPYSRFLSDERAAVRMALAAISRRGVL